MTGIKTTHGATGTSEVFSVTGISSLIYWADFTTGSGVGTVTLQVQTSSGDWIPADEAITATMASAEVAESPSSTTRHYRWNCSAYTSGSIITYLE